MPRMMSNVIPAKITTPRPRVNGVPVTRSRGEEFVEVVVSVVFMVLLLCSSLSIIEQRPKGHCPSNTEQHCEHHQQT